MSQQGTSSVLSNQCEFISLCLKERKPEGGGGVHPPSLYHGGSVGVQVIRAIYIIMRMNGHEWSEWSFPGISSIMPFRLLILKPCSLIMGQKLDPTVDYCQLLLYPRFANSPIMRITRGLNYCLP